jgi:hypothetical protein
MNLLERILKIKSDGSKPSREMNKADFAANLLLIQAELEKPDVVIAAEIFEAMDNDMRVVCLQGLLLISIATLESK